MKETASVYYGYMRECFRWAWFESDAERRQKFIELAKYWRSCALEIERAMGLIDESERIIKESKEVISEVRQQRKERNEKD